MLAPIACAECATEFTPKRRDGRFCSKGCCSAFGRKNRARRCERDDCDRPHRARGLCALHYRYKFPMNHRSPSKVRSDRRRTQERRALARGVESEVVEREVVAERDGWLCHLCDAPVDRSLKWPDSMSASIDHVIPIAHGGSHTYANVRLAHLTCNVRRGATPLEDSKEVRSCLVAAHVTTPAPHRTRTPLVPTSAA